MKKLLLGFIVFIGLTSSLQARILALTAGIGNWYSDDLRSSYQYGGGLLVRPGLDWLELSASFDRAPVQQKAGAPWAAQLQGKTLNFCRLGLTFPSSLQIFGLSAYLFPLLSYVMTSNANKVTSGFGLGGGLEFLLWKEIIGARFEALEQMYKIPTSAGQTGFQEDFFFALRMSVSY